MDRRDFFKRAAATSAGVALATVTESGLLSQKAWADVGGAPGATFGASVQPIGGQSVQDALLSLENMVGRKFTTVHNRFGWEGHLVNRYSEFIANRGQIPILSWFTRGRSAVRWASIAQGAQDARITSEAQALKAAGWPAYLCFHKEPENEPSLGNAAEWRAAHERVWQIFQNVGVTNATFVPCLMNVTVNGLFGGIRSWLPDHYDVLGIDGYNRNVDGRWKTFEFIFQSSHELATALGVPLFVIEYGCVEGAPGQKGQWFADADATIRSWPETLGVSYNNEIGHVNHDVGMNYRIDTSSSATAGFRTMGAKPFFNPTDTFYSSKGVQGPTGTDTGSTGTTDAPSTSGTPARTAAERRRHRRQMQRLRARRRRQAHRKHHAHKVNRAGGKAQVRAATRTVPRKKANPAAGARAVNTSSVSQSS
jgi:hypothetical protein